MMIMMMTYNAVNQPHKWESSCPVIIQWRRNMINEDLKWEHLWRNCPYLMKKDEFCIVTDFFLKCRSSEFVLHLVVIIIIWPLLVIGFSCFDHWRNKCVFLFMAIYSIVVVTTSMLSLSLIMLFALFAIEKFFLFNFNFPHLGA